MQDESAEQAQHWVDRAITAGRSGRTGEAALCLRRATALSPQSYALWQMLADVLLHRGENVGAVDAYQQALALQPNPHGHLNLGSALAKLDRSDESIAAMLAGVELAPASADARRGLGWALFASGQAEPAIEQLRLAIKLDPGNDVAHSLLLYAKLFQGTTLPLVLRDEHQQWAVQHTASVARLPPPPNDRWPDRRLRIGYVSPNFYNQAIAPFLLPIFQHHEPWEVEVFCYSDVIAPDATTTRLRAKPDAWRETTRLSHTELARQIREDRIDILVDLTGHIGGGRLQTFAAKPAPIQVAYLGYQATTGLTEMDYVLTDTWTDPPGKTEAFWVEKPWRLPRAFFCYEPHRSVAPPINPLPAIELGVVTFGCLNNIVKVTPRTLDLWCRVLIKAPGSRLVLLTPRGAATHQRLRQALNRRGVEGDRLEFIGRSSVADYLGQYHRIDLSLDPIPFPGHTTTCDAAWMGVPTVSLAGDCYAYRYGAGVMRHVGLSELVAADEDEYVSTATDLTRDLPRLAAVRASLRERMECSGLTDGRQFTRHLEAAYRSMWHAWCLTHSAG